MHESTSLDVNKANGLLTSNANSSSAKRSHALQQVKAARIGVICQGASIAPHFCLCPADCFQDILFEQARNSLWKKLAFLRHIKWHTWTVGAWKYLNWSRKQDAGMLTSNAKRIFCHNVTLVSHYALQEQKCFSNKSHLQECFNCSSLLACKGTAFNFVSN